MRKLVVLSSLKFNNIPHSC